jgi:hypothetical protein
LWRKALRQAIAQGDADPDAGRLKSYKAGELARELRDVIRKDEG